MISTEILALFFAKSAPVKQAENWLGAHHSQTRSLDRRGAQRGWTGSLTIQFTPAGLPSGWLMSEPGSSSRRLLRRWLSASATMGELGPAGSPGRSCGCSDGISQTLAVADKCRWFGRGSGSTRGWCWSLGELAMAWCAAGGLLVSCCGLTSAGWKLLQTGPEVTPYLLPQGSQKDRFSIINSISHHIHACFVCRAHQDHSDRLVTKIE